MNKSLTDLEKKIHILIGAIAQRAWGKFRRQITSKTAWYGKDLIAVGRFFTRKVL